MHTQNTQTREYNTLLQLLNIIIITLYRPPDVPPILFNEKLNDLLKMLQQENKTI